MASSGIISILIPTARPTIGPITLNLALSENWSRSNVIPKSAVEDGADRSQHIIEQPLRISIEAIISGNPDSRVQQAASFAIQQLGAAANAVLNELQVPSIIGVAAGGPDAPQTKVDNFFKNEAATLASQLISAIPQSKLFEIALTRMYALFESKTPFSYISNMRSADDMVFESLEIPQDATTDFLFRAELVQYRTVGVTREKFLADDQLDSSRPADSMGERDPKAMSLDSPLAVPA